MKYRYLFALTATVTGTAFAAMPATLPEFKNAKQLADWRTGKAAESSVKATAGDHAFYTGKPYVDASGGYSFKYRSYNPELARWTSEDPSGFPDGANASIYAPSPTSEMDADGLMTVSGNGVFYSGSFPGVLNYASYAAYSNPEASGNSGSVSLFGSISGVSIFTFPTSVTRTPTINITIDAGGNLNYDVVGSSGGNSGTVQMGFTYTFEGAGTKSLTVHVYSNWALNATGMSGVGTTSMSFSGTPYTDGPVGLGTFQFRE